MRTPTTPWYRCRAVVSPALIAMLPLLPPGAAMAGPNAAAKILLHILPTTSRNVCARPGVDPPCTSIVTSGNVLPDVYFVYLLVADGDATEGISGLQCGIEYNPTIGAGVDVFGFTLCATLLFYSTGWPESGGGALITWDESLHCQRSEPAGPGTGVVATAGYFYVGAYGPDDLKIIPRPRDGIAQVANCDRVEDVLVSATVNPARSPLGFVSFGGGAGYAPCGPGDTPNSTTTWSRLKGAHVRTGETSR